MKILFLSQRIPYPPNRGDKITTWRLVERMRREHEVRCVAFAHDEADLSAARELDGMGIPTTPIRHRESLRKALSLPLFLTCRPLTLGVYGSRALQRKVDELADWADMAYAYSSSMGAFLEPHGRLPRVMHFGELDSDKWRQYAERSGFPMSWVYRREHKALLEFEKRLAYSFTENVLCTGLEEQIFQEQIPGATTTVLQNGVDLEFFQPAPEEARPAELVFTGVMNYYPNVDGCAWFCREILPLVRERHPEVHFTIVGSHPLPEVEALARLPGVEVTGFVDDLRDYLRRASIAVAPLRIARGIQNKVLEAMAMGLPVVGTTCATQGVGAVSGRDYQVSDEAEALARHVSDLIDAPDKAREVGAAARRFVEENYDWELVFEHLDEILAKCSAARAETR